MRPVLHGDVSAAARVLYATPPGARAALAARLIAEARQADAFTRRTGRVHGRYGNGSLMGAARKRPLPPEPGFDDVDYCRCMALVLTMLADAARGVQAAPIAASNSAR